MAQKRKLIVVDRMKRTRLVARVAVLCVLAVVVILIPGQNIYTIYQHPADPILTPQPIPIPVVYPYPVNVEGVPVGEDVTAAAVVIRDVDSGVNLYTRQEQELLSPASTTKILTALVALDTFSLDDVLTVTTLMNSGQVMGLVSGERITLENLLYGALIHSGNDAAYAIAENYPGGVEAFVVAMNDKAKALHLTSSMFTNPVGYDDPNHKMTALDLSILGSAALKNKTIAKMVAIPSITISDVTHTYFHQLKNVNQLLGKIPGVAGIKTGWTEEAGENLVTLVERNGKRVIFVVLRSKDRFHDTAILIDWVFSNFSWQDFIPTPDIPPPEPLQ